MAALADVRKKWHIPAAFSVEFIGYYLDRISRLKEIKVSLQDQLELNKRLVDEQQVLRDQYEEVSKHLIFFYLCHETISAILCLDSYENNIVNVSCLKHFVY